MFDHALSINTNDADSYSHKGMSFLFISGLAL